MKKPNIIFKNDNLPELPKKHKVSIDDFKSYQSITILASSIENKNKKLMTKAYLSEEGVLRAKYIIEYEQDERIETIYTSYLDKAVKYYNEIE